jgi:sugar-specific transcriptional regulator TrmB
MILVMDLNLLEEIGLSKGETKVYLALLKLGSTKTGQLASKAGVSTSKVYKILDRLEKKGLAGHATKGKIRYYSAMEPNRIIEYLDEKEREISEKKELIRNMIPQLEMERKLAGSESEAVVYKGFKAISNFFRNILDDLHAGEEYYVLSAGYGEDLPGVRSFFQNYHTQRAKKKIKVKMLANYDIKNTIVPATKLNSEVRFLPERFISKMLVVFYKEKTFLFFLAKDPMGFLIKSKEIAESFRSYFDTLWKIAKE